VDRIIAAQVFVSIAERGSMIAAAQALDMSRAMVTRYLAQMESWAGTRLLHRTTRRLGLTVAGETTLERCRRMLEIAGDMPVAALPESQQLQGKLRIACPHSLGQTALAAAVAEYLRRHPGTAVDLQMGNQTVNLVEERIDLAIRITNQLDPNLMARPLATCDSVVCASPGYLATRGTPHRAEDLSLHNCLTYAFFGKSLWQFEHEGEPLAVPVSGNLSANDSMVLLHAAVEGAGITLQPRYSAAPLVAGGRLVALLPRYQPQQMGVHGIYASRQHMPATLRTMLDFLLEWFARDAMWRGVGVAAG
jgi:DNA-binding transcriptional LysR family regulator